MTTRDRGLKPHDVQAHDVLIWCYALVMSVMGQFFMFAAWNCFSLQHCERMGLQFAVLDMVYSPVYPLIVVIAWLVIAVPIFTTFAIGKQRAERRAA